ncbi:hypothetical protein ACN082_09825 [Rothia sp. CCM 9417]|uniref:phage terminase small subunit n=1 Tax=Rothia sp. CCM 9417 TaxID=3402657 RepID=UPI003AE0CAD2
MLILALLRLVVILLAAPKHPSRRARRNKDSVDWRTVEITPGEQPVLPERDGGWSHLTHEFWDALGELELSSSFTAIEWRLLVLAASLHEQIMTEGAFIRVDQLMSILGRFPLTPKDRQALRIQALTGDELASKTSEREQKVMNQQMEAINKFSGLRASK